MNGIQEILQRNTDLVRESATRADGSALGRICDALVQRRLAIIGPCAGQSVEQMEEIIAELQRTDPDLCVVLRCCPDKPRSLDILPNGLRSWHGIGVPAGAELLKKLKADHPELLFAAEIRHAEQLETLGPLLDLVWIGNREGRATIQTVSAAASSRHLPVFIKNSSVPGVEDMKARLIAGLEASSSFDESGRCVEVNNPVLPLLRGLPAEPDDPVYRNIPNDHWIKELRLWSPGIHVGADVGHHHKANPEQKNGDPKNLDAVKLAFFNALKEGANAVMAEITGETVPSMTDPGVPARALLEWLADASLPIGELATA